MKICRVQIAAESTERVTTLSPLNMVVLEEAFNSYFMQIKIWQFVKEFHRPHC